MKNKNIKNLYRPDPRSSLWLELFPVLKRVFLSGTLLKEKQKNKGGGNHWNIPYVWILDVFFKFWRVSALA